MFWESLWALWAMPPWLAFLDSACPRTTGSGSRAPEGREPVPGQEACASDDSLRTRGRHGLEQRLRAGLPGALGHALTVVVEDTDVHGAGMQVDAAVCLVLFGVESHEVASLFVRGFCLLSADHGGLLRRGPQ